MLSRKFNIKANVNYMENYKALEDITDFERASL